MPDEDDDELDGCCDEDLQPPPIPDHDLYLFVRFGEIRRFPEPHRARYMVLFGLRDDD